MPEPVAYALLARVHRVLDRAFRNGGGRPAKGLFDARGLPRPSPDGEDWLEALGLRSLDRRAEGTETAYLAVLLRRDVRRRERIERLARIDTELRTILLPGPETTSDQAGIPVREPEPDPVPVLEEAAPAPLPVPASAPVTEPVIAARRRPILAASLGVIAVAGLSAWLAMTVLSRPVAEPASAGVEMSASPAVAEPLPVSRPAEVAVPEAPDRIGKALRAITLTWLTGGRCGMTALGRF